MVTIAIPVGFVKLLFEPGGRKQGYTTVLYFFTNDIELLYLSIAYTISPKSDTVYSSSLPSFPVLIQLERI